MFASIKLFLTRCSEAVSSLIASIAWLAAKLLGMAFATGLAFGVIGAFIAGGVLWYFLSSSSIDDKIVYPHLIPNNEVIAANKGCGAPGNAVPTLADPNGSISGKHKDEFAENISADTANFYNCAIQSHINQSVSYTMAFLEFNDQGQLREPLQWKALEHELKSTTTQSLTVLVYVHGWRHDAHVGDSDVKRFHTLTSLTANYANQADRNPSKITNKTIGIYIGWRGRVVDEHADHGDANKLHDAMAIPTILSRKPASDSIAKPIGQQILAIEKLVKGDHLDAANRKLIVYGHSLGGNIVIQGLSETLASRIGKPLKDGSIRGVGDLVVLLNPASEARNFTDVQAAAIASKSKAFTSPVVVSLTASKYFDVVARSSSKWDTAVGQHLVWAHRFFSAFLGSPKNIQSIGNFLPITVMQGSPSVVVSSFNTGVSHEIEIDKGPDTKTSYKLAGKPPVNTHPQCPTEAKFMAWQNASCITATHIQTTTTSAQLLGPTASTITATVGWDTALKLQIGTDKPKPDSWLKLPNPATDEINPVRVNIRQGVARHICTHQTKDLKLCRDVAEAAGIDVEKDEFVKIPNIGPAWSPVWNAAVHSNVIAEHGGYLSHTLWCVLNRFALDRPDPKLAPTTK